MRSLSAQELLDVWERGQAQAPVERALSLLAASGPDVPEEALAQMAIGERDRLLLVLRGKVFGPDLEAVVRCPTCGEMLEMTVRSSTILASCGDSPGDIPPLHWNGYTILYRPANSQDLIAIDGIADMEEAKGILFERCILEATKDTDPILYGQLPGGALDAVMGAMEVSDPQANISLYLTCPGCGENWKEAFDILSFFWEEIENWAGRTLDDVHLLALAYGWSEEEVLSLSAARRQRYLERVTE